MRATPPVRCVRPSRRMPVRTAAPARRAFLAVAAALLLSPLALAACSGGEDATPLTRPCTDGGRDLVAGFYAYFAPVSYSAGEGPDSPDFGTHLGYEADLLTALELMEGAGLSFDRRPIEPWADIWLRSAGDGYDIIGGGITILDSRRRDASGAEVVAFTSGHIAFRQSLLVRAEDAERLRDHDALTSADRVGVLANTTGEARLLQLTGLADVDGVLAAGVRIETRAGEIVADGSDAYVITAAAFSPAALDGRRLLSPPAGGMPQVVYLGGELGEAELLEALASGEVDAIARGEIGNRAAVRVSGGAFAVTALDPATEWGGFTLSIDDTALRECIDAKINYLTDGRRIGYAEWVDDPSVFRQRADQWNEER